MDASSLSILSDPEEKMQITKPRVLIRRSKFDLSKPTLYHLKPNSETQDHSLKNFPAESALVSNQSYIKEPKKINSMKTNIKSRGMFYAFEGNKLSITSLLDYKSTSEDLTPLIYRKNRRLSNDSRTKSKNFRRLKRVSVNIQASELWFCQDPMQGEENPSQKKNIKKNKMIKRELIPQTKASAHRELKQKVPELRISGVIKDITYRDRHTKVKDFVGVTDYEYLTLSDVNIN